MLIAGAISVSVRYDYWSTSRYYNFVAVTGIVIAVIVTLLYVFRITDRFEKIPWNFIEMIYDVLWAILALIAAAILTDYARKYQEMDSYAAGAVSLLKHSLKLCRTIKSTILIILICFISEFLVLWLCRYVVICN